MVTVFAVNNALNPIGNITLNGYKLGVLLTVKVVILGIGEFLFNQGTELEVDTVIVRVAVGNLSETLNADDVHDLSLAHESVDLLCKRIEVQLLAVDQEREHVHLTDVLCVLAVIGKHLIDVVEQDRTLDIKSERLDNIVGGFGIFAWHLITECLGSW